jgi:TonB family protein
MNNALNYSLQVLLLIGAGALLPYLFRLRLASARLLFWQGLLALCLLLPVIQPRQMSQISVTMDDGPLARSVPVKIAAPSTFPISDALFVVYITGAVARGLWLLLGLIRLRRYRRSSRQISASPVIMDTRQALGIPAEIRLSEDISGPVTFGLNNPVILFPPSFLNLDEGSQHAIVIHELIHVKRRDWIFSISEEVIRAAFWFHPAIWWLLGQIQLTREQVVDRAAIEFTSSREQYLEALLAVAKTRFRPDLALAPLFLKKRHLAQRVAAIVTEVSMSKRRIISSLATVFALALLTARVSVWIFPLESFAQESLPGQGSGVSVDTQGHKLLHGSRIEYPAAARRKQIEGTVVLELSLDGKGEVSDARVLSGPDELRNAALSSVLQWHFESESARPATIQVSVSFKDSATSVAESSKTRLPELPSSGPLKKIEYVNVPESVRSSLESRLAKYQGETLTRDSLQQLTSAMRDVDEHLGISFRTDPSDNSATAFIYLGEPAVPFDPPATPGVKRVRIGGNVQSSKIINKVTPLYPPLAKQARIQGTVRFNTLIGQDGDIKVLALVGGHPILVDSAKTAVAQWKYQPTLLNGEPVEVITVIDVNYTLSQ